MVSEKLFQTFLTNIEPSKTTKEMISSIQQNLRSYLANHNEYKYVYADSFLSGSYAKHTSIRPKKGDGKRDVDIIIITNYNPSSQPQKVLDELYNILSESNHYKNIEKHSHSIGIEMSNLEIDVVPVIKDNNGRMFIGNNKTNAWSATDPAGHLKWCSNANKMTNGKFIPCVKLFKWWRRNNFGGEHDCPKGITLEKIVADNIPTFASNIEECFIETMRSIINNYLPSLITGTIPHVYDPCILDNDLLNQYSLANLLEFFLKMMEHLKLVNTDNSCENWITIFGDAFPSSDKNSLGIRGEEEEFIEEIVSINKKYDLKIDCKVSQNGFRQFLLSKNVFPLKHDLNLDFFIESTDAPTPYSIYWKVRNVGEEAIKRNDIRGQIIRSNKAVHHENTRFRGPHFVECYIIKDGICVAIDRINVPIGSK